MNDENKTKYAKMVDYNKQKSIAKEQLVEKKINNMRRSGKPISFYSVSKAAGVSRNFLYNNKKLKDLIMLYRNGFIQQENNEPINVKELLSKIDKLERDKIDKDVKIEKLNQVIDEIKKENKSYLAQLAARR